MFTPALKPLARIAITFAIVWFYQGLTTAYFDGLVQVVVVVLLAVPTWIVVGRALFPARRDDGGSLFGGRSGRAEEPGRTDESGGTDESGRTAGSDESDRSGRF